jgi:hypothetical protein
MDGSTPSTNAPNGNTSPNSAENRVGMTGICPTPVAGLAELANLYKFEIKPAWLDKSSGTTTCLAL